MMRIDWHEHASREALGDALGRGLAEVASEAITDHGEAVLSLAGGSTPLPSYRAFARHRIDWDRVQLVPGDERWVPPMHPDSNLKQLRLAFAAAPGVRLQALVPAIVGPDPDDSTATAVLAGLADRPFDLVLLGLGEDGHIASLFPGTDALDEANTGAGAPDALVVRPTPSPPGAPHPRVSLSLPRLLRTKRLWMAISGDAKRRLLEQVEAGGHAESPVGRLLAAGSGTLDVHWSP